MYNQMTAPTDSQISTLMSLPPDVPIGVLNLFQFHTKARYKEEDPEFGTPEADISGEQAYGKYAHIAGKFIEQLGGRVVFSSPVDQVMIGQEDIKWDLTAIMYFPTRQVFIKMLTDPKFQKVSRHRKAALANHFMMHIDGYSFKDTLS